MPTSPSPSRPSGSRARSSTIIGTIPPGGAQPGPPALDVAASSFRITTQLPAPSAAAESLSNLTGSLRRPRLTEAGVGHNRVSSWPSPPQPGVMHMPSAPAVPTRGSMDAAGAAGGKGILDLSSLEKDRESVALLLYTYKPTTPTNIPSATANPQPSPLPSTSSSPSTASSQVILNYAALPWDARPGDYLEIRQIRRPAPAGKPIPPGPTRGVQGLEGEKETKAQRPPALMDVKAGKGREGYVFRLGENSPAGNVHQIQVPDSVAAAFGFQHRLEVEVRKINDKESAHTDYVEFYFSQYLGRADMWRLGMSLEGTTLHVGEKVSLAGGAVRAEVNFVIRNDKGKDKPRKFSSGIVTAKTKTIFRSKSAQVYLFIQLCQETWQFDEDGERYVEKVVHGYLPELFARWAEKGTSHVVTIIFFSRIFYSDTDVETLRSHDMLEALNKDYSGRWYKDFFKVAIDLERRNDWTLALPEIKKQLEKSEDEILRRYHWDLLREHTSDPGVKVDILGSWSFAYEGNVLEAINLALNPFDEHHVDRDLSRTGLSISVITPGTGHFAVDKNLLRLTTERMVDHGMSVDFVCLTKMPLHSVPLFSYVSHRPKGPIRHENELGVRMKPVTPDLLYFDAHMSQVKDTELADCYSLPSWVSCSFYAVTHDKPFREDRFVARCKMYDIQMLGILDHNLTTVTVPLLDVDDVSMPRRPLDVDGRKSIRDAFDENIFRAKPEVVFRAGGGAGASAGGGGSPLPGGSVADSFGASYQSARLLEEKRKEGRSSSMSMTRPKDFPGPGGAGGGVGGGSRLSPIKAMAEMDEPELGKKTELRGTSPAPSSISLKKGSTRRSLSPTKMSQVAPTGALGVGQGSGGGSGSGGGNGQGQLGGSRGGSPTTTTRSISPLPSLPEARGALPPLGKRPASPFTATGGKAVRNSSPSRASVRSIEHANSSNGTTGTTGGSSGASTPKVTPAHKLSNKTSKSSFASRIGVNWVLGLTRPGQPTIAHPARVEATRKTDDVSVKDHRPISPAPSIGSLRGRPLDVPKPMAIVTPSTPSPSREKTHAQAQAQMQTQGKGLLKSTLSSASNSTPTATPVRVSSGSTSGAGGNSSDARAVVPASPSGTRPLPIAFPTARGTAQPPAEDDGIARSLRATKPHHHSGAGGITALSRSHDDASWGAREKANALVQSSRHFTINPCKPSAETIDRVRDAGGRRWRFVLPKQQQQHIVQWPSLLAPACLPLTTDFMPNQDESDKLYNTGTYTVQCYLEDGAFLIRGDAAESDLPLAMMREMVSQRLSQNFQVIVLPIEKSDPTATARMPIHLDKDADMGVELVTGGASEVLKRGEGAIWLSWANHLHRLLFHPTKQEIVVHWMTRRVSHSTEPVEWKGLVWPGGMKGYQPASAKFSYPDVSMKVNYNHLDHLINGDRQTLDGLRYWRTRFILIPSGREPMSLAGMMPKNEHLGSTDLLWLGAQKVIETLNRYLLKGDKPQVPLRIVTTTFDPSTCVLDEELMMDLERQISGKESTKGGAKMLQGTTLASLAELMCQPGNGLVIRTRWWESRQHVMSFNGAQFCEWLQNTFEDVTSRDNAQEWAKTLLEKGLISHVTNSHGFLDYWHLYYRLREPYSQIYAKLAEDRRKEKEKEKEAASKNKSWFSSAKTEKPDKGEKAQNGGSAIAAGIASATAAATAPTEGSSHDTPDLTASTSTVNSVNAKDRASANGSSAPPEKVITPPGARELLAKIYQNPNESPEESENGDGEEVGKKKKKKKVVWMTQTRILDLDQSRKSDRAEVAVLHADVVHNARNAFHFELNWLGVTAALLEELRAKVAAQAERYGLRFVETPVEQIADLPLKCAYRTPIPILLALPPPVIPDLHLRLVAVAHGTGQAENYFEYCILTKKFGFVLDVEAANRYPDNIDVKYSYRKSAFTYSQFCHKTGLALVQCRGGRDGFLWSDNRLVVSAAMRRGVGNRVEEARALRREMEEFCGDKEALRKFYEEVLPPLPGNEEELEAAAEEEEQGGGGEKIDDEELEETGEKVEA
ncbi:hypothetical protein IAT38_001226 [Cryptococcus sp. DSM 104549]